MFAFIAANFNAKLKLVRSRTQDPLGMSSAGGTSSRNGSIKDRVRRTVLISLDGQRKAYLSGQPWLKGSVHSSKDENPYYGSQRYYKDVQWLNKVKTKQVSLNQFPTTFWPNSLIFRYFLPISRLVPGSIWSFSSHLTQSHVIRDPFSAESELVR